MRTIMSREKKDEKGYEKGFGNTTRALYFTSQHHNQAMGKKKRRRRYPLSPQNRWHQQEGRGVLLSLM